jgi:hypothetical protein
MLDSGKPLAEREEYADALRRCFVACSRDILVVGTDTNSSACAAGMTMPMLQIVIVCAGLLVHRTITFVGASSTQSLGFTSSHFRRRFSVKLPGARAWVVGSIATHRRLGTIHAPIIHTKSTIFLSSRMI